MSSLNDAEKRESPDRRNESRQALDTDACARRRTLLKGSVLAAPMVLTLRSGAALAITSVEQCLQRLPPTAPAKAALGAGEGEDIWVRKEVQSIKLTPPPTSTAPSSGGGKGGSKKGKGGSSGGGASSPTTSSSPEYIIIPSWSGATFDTTKYWDVTEINASSSAPTTVFTQSGADWKRNDEILTGYQSAPGPKYYLLVRIDPTSDSTSGTIVGFGNFGDGRPIDGSCWCSVNANDAGNGLRL